MDEPYSTALRCRFGAAHLAWTAMFLGILIWGLHELTPGTLGNTGNWYRIGLVLFGAVAGVMALLGNASRLPQALSAPLLLLLCYGVLAMVSSIYIPQHSFYSLWKGFEVVVDIVAIAAVMTYARPEASVRLAYRIIITAFSIMIGLFWIEALIMPSSAFVPSRGLLPYSLQGVMPITNGNGVAFLSAVVAFALWCQLLRSRSGGRRFLALLGFGVAVATLIVAQSRTSVTALVLAICIQLLFDRRLGLFLVVGIAATAAVALTTFSDIAGQYLVRGQSRELMATLSGRTHGWQAAWSYFLESPVLGHGFAAAARTNVLGITGASTLHGAVFDVMVGVGLLGLIPWILAIALTTGRMLRLSWESVSTRISRLERSHRAEMVGLLTLVLVRSTTSSGLALHEHTFMLFLVVVAFSAVTLRARRRPAGVDVASRAVLIDSRPTPVAR